MVWPINSPPGHLLTAFALLMLGFVVCLGAAMAAIRWVAPLGLIDSPGPRKLHLNPTPRTGGIALWFSLSLAQLLGWLHLPITTEEWLCLHGLALLGALDDRFSLSARVKAWTGFGLAITLAIPVAQAFALDRPFALLMKIPIPTSPPWFTLPLLVLWFWALPQAMNLIDGLNGLATGLALLASAFMLFGGKPLGAPFLLGALLAVFILNWPKAFHFLGDCGAYFLGGLLGLLALRTRAFVYPSLALWIFAYPIFDMTLVIVIRLLHGHPLGNGDRNHLHHQWSRVLGPKAGWTPPLLWLQAAALGVGPTGFPGSAYLCWPALGIMVAQCGFFAYRSLHRSLGTSPIEIDRTP